MALINRTTMTLSGIVYMAIGGALVYVGYPAHTADAPSLWTLAGGFFCIMGFTAAFVLGRLGMWLLWLLAAPFFGVAFLLDPSPRGHARRHARRIGLPAVNVGDLAWTGGERGCVFHWWRDPTGHVIVRDMQAPTAETTAPLGFGRTLAVVVDIEREAQRWAEICRAPWLTEVEPDQA